MDWPFQPIERVPAFVGEDATLPDWYGGDEKPRYKGAWGCLQSHLGIWRQALKDGLETVLIFEDDAVFAESFSQRALTFVRAVPADWDQIYFGGQHIDSGRCPPVRVNEHVILGNNVNRTHAYAITQEMMQFCIERLTKPWPPQTPLNYYNFDFQLGFMHKRDGKKPYCPPQWLCGQAAGRSDVNPGGAFHSTLWWKEFPIIETRQEPVSC